MCKYCIVKYLLISWNVVSDKTGLVSVSIHHDRYDGEKSSASLTIFQTSLYLTLISVYLANYPYSYFILILVHSEQDQNENIFILQLKLYLAIRKALPPSNVRFSNPEHVDGSLVQLDKHAIEDLAQTEKLQNFADFGADTIDTRKQM